MLTSCHWQQGCWPDVTNGFYAPAKACARSARQGYEVQHGAIKGTVVAPSRLEPASTLGALSDRRRSRRWLRGMKKSSIREAWMATKDAQRPRCKTHRHPTWPWAQTHPSSGARRHGGRLAPSACLAPSTPLPMSRPQRLPASVKRPGPSTPATSAPRAAPLANAWR